MVKRNAEAELQLPPGFRFFPTDEELVVHYLCKKAASQILPVPIIAEVDLYKYDPWQLPEKALFGEKEWYFFTPRDRKYPNGSRPNRSAGSGYWKATGADKPITMKGGNKRVGIKKALVFYAGKAPKGTKSNWIMHEYRMADINRPARKKGSLRLDDWVLCRIYNKKSSAEKLAMEQKQCSLDEEMDSFEVIDEKEVEIVPTLNSVEHSSIEQTKSSSQKLSKMDPYVTNCNVMSGAGYSMKYNNSSQNPGFFHYTMPLDASSVKVPVQNQAFNPIRRPADQWRNYNSTDLLSGLHTDSSSSKPSYSEPSSEREEVQSSFKLETFSEKEQQESIFNFDLEGLENPFSLDQITFPDPYQDYFNSLSATDYLPRFYPNDTLLQ